MRFTRQQILLAMLGLIAVMQLGDWVLNSLIQGPMQVRKAKTEQLQSDISEREKLLAEGRAAGTQIEAWQKQSLPADGEVARTVYRSWLLALVKTTQLRSAVVDSGTPSARRAKDGTLLFRTMPFSVRCRGGLAEFNSFLFQFSKAGHLHQISSMTLNPIAATGQFDISIGIETLLLAGRKSESLNTGSSTLLASAELKDYENIVKDNIFGVGINTIDPMKTTAVSAITFSNGVPQVWITEEFSGRTIRAGLNEEFSTVALNGRIVEVKDHEVIIDQAGEHMRLLIGKPFAEATRVAADVTR
jgi:hypothetical protein